jgi:AcrR family transcriptional regulator
VELILDTAAGLIDEVGYGNITPALIARRAGMSGPAIYRYFDDLDAIALALAARNLERYLERSREMLEGADRWEDAIAGSVQAYSDFYRSEPGFRWLRLGEPIVHNLHRTSESNKTLLARSVTELFIERYEVEPRTELLGHVEIMVEIGDSLIAKAFEASPDGDPFFLRECTTLMVSYLGEYLARPIA